MRTRLARTVHRRNGIRDGWASNPGTRRACTRRGVWGAITHMPSRRQVPDIIAIEICDEGGGQAPRKWRSDSTSIRARVAGRIYQVMTM